CLAHVINLAMKAVISAYSKAKHYDPHSPDAHEPDVNLTEHDEVGLIRAILVKHANDAQHEFSAEQHPTLQNSLIALESLHSAWDARMKKSAYSRYTSALEAGVEKLATYYDHTLTLHAYTLAMILDPTQKISHFQKQWDTRLCKHVRDDTEDIFKTRYLEMYGNNPPPVMRTSFWSKKGRRLATKLSSSDKEEFTTLQSAPAASSSTSGPNSPWTSEFNCYLNSEDKVEEDISLIQWWGLNSTRYPVWASLAQDYLAIMASSVSSKQAFSSAGLTITKRRNRLNADVVEALQFVKCALRTDLLFREEVLTFTKENIVVVKKDDGSTAWQDVEEKTWDEMFFVNDNEEEDADLDIAAFWNIE
ncbi:hypothetical protein C0991_002006, partial [Blastosporella zonata]